MFTTGDLAPGSHVITATYNGTTGFHPSLARIVQNVASPAGSSCSAPITVPASGAATPYPSTLTVDGTGSETTQVTVRLDGVTHTFPADLDVLLVGPTGANVVLMSDVGAGADANGVALTFSDFAQAAPVPSVTGTYLPTNGAGSDPWPAPAPAASGATALATFNGTNPNGTWSLYVFDDAAIDGGSMAGWCVFVATAIAPTVTSLTSSPNPSSFEQPVTFTATVTSEGNPVTEGTVTFTDATTG